MRDLGTELSNHLMQESTTLCTCWILTVKDGAQFGFTNHDADILLDSVVCKAVTGWDATEAGYRHRG